MMKNNVLILLKRIFRVCAVVTILGLPHFSQAAPGDLDTGGRSILGWIRAGVIDHNMYKKSNDVGGFFEYNFGIPFIGIKVGLEYGVDTFAIIPNELSIKNINDFDIEKYRNKPEISSITKGLGDIQSLQDITSAQKKIVADFVESEWGGYRVKYLSVPVIMRVYPFAGDLGISFGIRMDYLLSVKGMNVGTITTSDIRKVRAILKKNEGDKSMSKMFRVADEIGDLAKEMNKNEDKNFKDEPIFNSIRWNFVWGVDYTFFFGGIIGVCYVKNLSSFVNFNSEKSCEILDFSLNVTVGFDVFKIIKWFC